MCRFRINNTLQDILFEGNLYWKDLTAFVSWRCKEAQGSGFTAGQSGEETDTAQHRLYSDGSLSILGYGIPQKGKRGDF